MQTENWVGRARPRLVKIMLLQASVLATLSFGTTPGARASFSPGTVDFGTVLLGATKCVSLTWSNMTPGNALICDANGCRTTWPEVVRSATFASTLPASANATIGPAGATNVAAATGTVSVNHCVTPSTAGEFNAQLNDAVSPAYHDGTTSSWALIHLKAVAPIVQGEPVGGTLDFGAVDVGQTRFRSFVLYNYTASPVTVNAISTGVASLTVTGGVGAVIPANGGSHQVAVTYAPQAAGYISGEIQVTTTGGDASYPYTGAAFAPPPPPPPPAPSAQVPAVPALGLGLLASGVVGFAAWAGRRQRKKS